MYVYICVCCHLSTVYACINGSVLSVGMHVYYKSRALAHEYSIEQGCVAHTFERMRVRVCGSLSVVCACACEKPTDGSFESTGRGFKAMESR